MPNSIRPSAASQSLGAASGSGAMINWITIAEDDLPLYEDWYSFEHLPERVSTPGFIRARRFIANEHTTPGTLDYLTVYETETPQILASAEYLHRLNNPTALTKEVVPRFQNFRRAACSTTVSAGVGSSGRIVAIEVSPQGDSEAIRASLRETAFPEAIARHHMHAGAFYEPHDAITAAKSQTDEGKESGEEPAGMHLLVADLPALVSAEELACELISSITDSSTAQAEIRPPRTFELIYDLRSHPTRTSH